MKNNVGTLFICCIGLFAAVSFLISAKESYSLKQEIAVKDQKINAMQESVDHLQGEIKKHEAITRIIDSRCVDVYEPSPIEVGE